MKKLINNYSFDKNAKTIVKLSDLNDDKNYVNKTQAIALSIALGG